jgi:hypothetical protein
VFYGDDAAHKSWGDVMWRRDMGDLGAFEAHRRLPPFNDPSEGDVLMNNGKGTLSIAAVKGGRMGVATFALQSANENGDGTVPTRSGHAPRYNVKVCVGFAGVDHEAAYKNTPQQLFALWAITKIAYRVKQTSMAYRT